MKIRLTKCPGRDATQLYNEIQERGAGDYLEVSTMGKSSALFINIYDDVTWVGYALLEPLRSANIESLLEDIWEEDELERAMNFIDIHMKKKGYFLHVLEIFEEYQYKGLGTQAEGIITEMLDAPILLYTVSDSETYWLRQGYESLDGEYYLYKGVKQKQVEAIK